MSKPSPPSNRVLLIDDNAAIHGDFRKVLSADAHDGAQETLARLEADLFGEAAKTAGARPNFEVDSAYQGKEGVAMVRAAL